jgi:hypothetical protein
VAAGSFGLFSEKDPMDKDRQRDSNDSKRGVCLPIHELKAH